MNNNLRFTTLDGMRGIAAISVMLHHYIQNIGIHQFGNTALAVELFFCLGGFVLTYSYKDKLGTSMTIKKFIVRRLIRLYPMFLIGLSIGTVAIILKSIHGQTNLDHENIIAAIFCNIFYLPYFNDFFVQIQSVKIESAIFPINDPSWSLFFALVANFIFATLFFLPRKIKLALILMLIGAISLFIYSKVNHSHYPGWSRNNFYGGLPRIIYSFFMGVVIFQFHEKYRHKIPSINPLMILVCVPLLFLQKNYHHHWVMSIFLFIPALILLGSVSTTYNFVIKRLFGYLAWISYPLYCVHFPIFSIVSSIVSHMTYIHVFICSFISLSVAHITAKFVDEPLRRTLHKINRRKEVLTTNI